MPAGLRHPFTDDLYEQDGEGGVLVTTTDGRTGRFRADGSRLDGDVYDVDPQLCGWIAGARPTHRLAKS